MEKFINHLHGWIYLGLAVITVIILAVNGLMAIAGTKEFAYWHLGTPFIFYWMGRSQFTDVEVARFIIKLRLAKQKATKTFVSITRAVSSLPALFIDQYNHFQTEP